MKQVVKVRMLPTQEQAAALGATLATSNEAGSWLSAVMHAAHVRHKRFYTELKQRFGLSAQPAIRVIGNVADSYATLKANIEAGNYGPPGSEKRKNVQDTPIRFRADAAQPFDARCLSWQIPDAVGVREATVSIWTTAGRCKGVRILAAPHDLVTLRTRPIGETDLIYQDGKWSLHATVDAPEAPLAQPVNGFLGGGSGHREHCHQQQQEACRWSASQPVPQASAAAAGAVAGQEDIVSAAAVEEAAPQGGAVRH